eukprot:345263-Rhodomonas_salina.2
MDRGWREQGGCNRDTRPRLRPPPTAPLTLSPTRTGRPRPSGGIRLPSLVPGRPAPTSLSLSLAQGHCQPAPSAASVGRAHRIKELGRRCTPCPSPCSSTSPLPQRQPPCHGDQVSRVVVHGDAHCREPPPGGPDQGQELHVLVPVERGAGAVLGAH